MHLHNLSWARRYNLRSIGSPADWEKKARAREIQRKTFTSPDRMGRWTLMVNCSSSDRKSPADSMSWEQVVKVATESQGREGDPKRKQAKVATVRGQRDAIARTHGCLSLGAIRRKNTFAHLLLATRSLTDWQRKSADQVECLTVNRRLFKGQPLRGNHFPLGNLVCNQNGSLHTFTVEGQGHFAKGQAIGVP